MNKTLGLEDIQIAVKGKAAAFRCVTKLQPAGGRGDKVFPPTYEGGKYAVEQRIINGQTTQCVLLDSVQSQANRMELALLEAKRAKRITLPLITVNFDHKDLKKKFTVTSLEAPHRIADAILRDSLYQENGQSVIFRKSSKGIILDTADVRNATGLFGICPTALLFGIWDSTGPRGGLGAKLQRAIVSEIMGIDSTQGIATGGKVDALNILKEAGPLYHRKEQSDTLPNWSLEQSQGAEKLGKKKDGKPSEANLGGIPPDFSYARDKKGNIIYENGVPRIKGGFTIDYALQTTVLSLAALRRLCFPLNGDNNQTEANDEARTVLAALGIASATLAMEEGYDLRSRCQLFPTEAPIWELLNVPGEQPQKYVVNGDQAVVIFEQAVKDAQSKCLPWEGDIILKPSDDLVALVQKSQELAMSIGVEEE